MGKIPRSKGLNDKVIMFYVKVSWCIYKAEVADDLGDIWDLVFLSKIEGAGIVNEREKRPNTGSNALEFTAVNSKFQQYEKRHDKNKDMSLPRSSFDDLKIIIVF